MKLQDFKLSPPIENFNWLRNTSQLFGVNASRYKTDFNIPGHNGIDIIIPEGPDAAFGTPILASHDGIVIGTSNDLSRSRGSGVILQTLLDDGTVVQTTYWHLSEVLVKGGEKVNVGQPLGRMGNTGYVFPEPSAMCPHCGTHLHFALSLFRNGKPLFTDYGNFVDPTPYLYKTGDKLPIHLPWNLSFGFNQDVVSWLQTLLKIEGYAEDYIPIGCFGWRTRRDVIALQTKHNITPIWGYVGPITRKYLNDKYSGALTRK